MAEIRLIALMLALIVGLWESAGSDVPRFLSDDPIQAMPAPLPVEKPARQNIHDLRDFLSNSSNWKPRPAKPARAVNTLGEVPDSEWFTNRHGKQHMSAAELKRGPVPSEAPLPPFVVTGGKTDGITPGFRMKDSKGGNYFVKTDPLNYPELTTSADVIASKFLYAIGYNVPKNEIVDLRLSDLHLSNDARITRGAERPHKMVWSDVEQIVQQIPHYANGSFRIVASLAIEGENIGPFLYEGTRSDDPNDLVPHEDRRDLRGLGVFSAWLNNTDAKASNTLDVVVTENRTRFVRHYLIDFGSALGSDGDAPKDARLGHEFMLGTPTGALKQILSLGLFPAPWERARFPKLQGAGNFESRLFDPDTWRPDYPNPAFMSRLPDDDYWAAKQVMRFTDDDIRGIVETARFTDPRSTEYIIKVLAERRNKIGKTYFSKVLPLDHFRIENEELQFDDLAVQYGFHEARPYQVRWSRFDNLKQKNEPIPGGSSTRLPPVAVQAPCGTYFSALIYEPGQSRKAVSVYIRKERHSYKVVGVDRSW